MRAFEIFCLALAGGLLVANVVRLVRSSVMFVWWAPVVAALAAICADLVSGLVHWTADTWGSESLPLIGRRFLLPFRVHHLNPDDFLRRDPIDCNGDVAMLNAPILAAALLTPLTMPAGRVVALALVAFAAAALPTNQVHQWAHMPSPPALIRWLQRRGVILTREAHARHHAMPYVVNYCIATGWCNRLLTAIDFFPAVERAITRLTGWQPRADEHVFAAKLDAIREQ
jgi:ubiquitin-conjugating enzyme E2 variant